MRKKGWVRSAIVIVMLSMFLVGTVNVAFRPVFSEEVKYEGEPSTIENPPLNVTVQKGNSRATYQTTTNPRTENLFSSLTRTDSFDRNQNSDGIRERRDLVSLAENSVEFVVGVNDARPDACAALTNAIGRGQGEIMNTVSIKGETIAFVARMPSKNVAYFAEEAQKGNLARYIQPRVKFQALFVPNDPEWAYQWGPQKIEVDSAWNTTTGSHSVLVAIIDTGIDYTHPDLAANYVPLGYDGANNDSDPLDDNGHGTHCAGIVAAVLNNSIGIAGVANVSIMAEKGLDASGSGWDDDLANAIIHAVDQGADVLSNSWGGYQESYLIRDAVQYANSHGVLIIAAAGNGGWSTKLYPAAYDEVIAVTATDSSDNPAVFSNFGDWVEVAAPGVDILSTFPTYDFTLHNSPYNKNLYYDYLSGTSMACPHVAGLAALVKSRFPNATRDWIRMQIRYTVDDLGPPGFDVHYGYGRINAQKAIEQAPPAHDLVLFELSKPKRVQPGETVLLNATVLNFGASDEHDVLVQLFVNNTLTNADSITHLASGTTTTASLSWNPLVEGTYNVTLYIVPVPGETATQNNLLTKMVLVRNIVHWILLDQTRCDPISFYSMWVENMTSKGYAVDTYDFGTITSEGLRGYDAFVVPQAVDSYSADEISAIEAFVMGGGGLMVIGDNYPFIYSALTEFAGITWSPEANGWWGNTSDITSHEVTAGVSWAFFNSPLSQLEVSSPATGLIRDSYGYGEVMLAASEIGAGRVVGIADENTIDDTDIGQSDNLRLAMNAIDWLFGVKYEHELAVGVRAADFVEPGTNSTINATVYNAGLRNETNVELVFLINNSIVSDTTIPTLVNGTSYTVNYLFVPSMQGAYNLTAYTPPVPDENVTVNNVYIKYVYVRYPLIKPIEGQYANYTIKYFDAYGNPAGTGFWNFTYDHYVDKYLIFVSLWSRDISGVEGTDWMIVNTMTRMVEAGVWMGLWYPGWIEIGLHVGSPVNLIYDTVYANVSKTIPVGLYPIDCWEFPLSVQEFLWHDKVSGLWIGMDSTAGPYSVELRLADTNVPIGTKYEHELVATVEAPDFLEPTNSSTLNATVYNIGLNTESYVDLSLLINGTEVKSTVIPALLNGSSYVLSYLWTPVLETVYNVTAYVQPVYGENITDNNVATKMVHVRTVKGYILFDQTHKNDLALSYSIWINDLLDKGYVVDTLTSGPITPSSLESYGTFVIPQVQASFNVDEITVIQNYVRNGGGLLVIGSDLPSSYNSLTNFAGILWSYGGYWGYTSNITPHPVTDGVNTAYFNSPCIIYTNVTSRSLIRDYAGDTILAVSTVGTGAVIGIADQDSINDGYISYGDNRRLAGNMMDWLMTRPPTASFTYSPHDPYVGEAIAFDASASYDPDGTIMGYSWSFGDGTTGEGVAANHFYTESGTYIAMLTVRDDDGLNSTVSANVTVARTTLDVQVKAGSIHFRGETVEFYILASSLGKMVDANVSATLYFNGSAVENLASIEHVTTGLYRIPYAVPLNASAGTYTLVAEMSYLTLNGVAIESFLLSPTFSGWDALLIDINGTVGNIKTSLGTVEVKLDAINATLVSIDERTLIINSTLGLIRADIDTVNATLTGLAGTVATIQTNLGTIMVNVADIKLEVVAINGTAATVQTTLGTMEGTITDVQGDVATVVVPGVGTIQTDVSKLQKAQDTNVVSLYVILAITLIAAAASVLSAILILRSRNTPKPETPTTPASAPPEPTSPAATPTA
jgi:thermitase